MSKKNKDEIIESAIAGGLVGAALGALITGKSKSALVSALVGAAVGASLKAQQQAKDIDAPVLYEIDGSIYKVYPDGEQEFVRKIKKPSKKVPRSFKLD